MYRTAIVLCGVLLVVLFGAQAVRADSGGVTYTISGVYSPTTNSSPLSGPSDTFLMSFTVPTHPVADSLLGDSFAVDSPIPFSFSASNGGTASGPAYLSFYSLSSSSQPGGFFVDFCANGPSCLTGLEYQWEVTGALLYSGPESSPTMIPTSFGFTGGQFTLYHCTFCDNTDATGTFSGTVNSVVATPEPASALLLLLGTLGIFAAGYRQKRLRPLARG